MKTNISFVDIARRLRELPLPDTQLVIGIADGGTVPANLVAYKLGCELRLVKIRYRNEANAPEYPAPVVSAMPDIPAGIKNILIVDDVSVSGKTIVALEELLNGYETRTLVFKGTADYVLFPEIANCVNWPWKLMS